MEFGEVSRVKSVFINESVVLYHSVRKPVFVYKFNRKTVCSCVVSVEVIRTELLIVS